MAVDVFSSLKLVTRDLRNYRSPLAASILSATVSVLLDMVPIWCVYRLIDAVVRGVAAPQTFFAYAAIMAVTIPTAQLMFEAATRASHTVIRLKAKGQQS